MAYSTDTIMYGGDLMIFVASAPIAFSTNAKLSVSTKTRDISNKDSSNWTEKKSGRFDWNFSSDAFMNFATSGTTQSIDDLYLLFSGGSSVAITFASKSGTSPSWTANSGIKYFSGSAILTSFDFNSPDAETPTYTISGEGTGALTLV